MHVQTRREFLRTSRNLGLGAAVASLLPRLAWANAMGLPPGIQLYTVRELLPKDTPGTLKQLYQIGFREVETAGYGKYTAAEFKKMLDDAGLKAPSAHLSLSHDIDKALADAHAQGAHYVVSSSLTTELMMAHHKPGTPRPAMKPFTEDDFKRVADEMNKIGKQVKASGLQYAIHNHNYEFVKMPDGRYGYDIILASTDPELVKLEVDCGWMVVAGASPVAYFHKYPGRFKMMHIKDFKKPAQFPDTDLTGPNRPQGVNLGDGFIDYKPIFAAGKKEGIVHAFSEQEDPFPVSQIASAKADYAYIHAAS